LSVPPREVLPTVPLTTVPPAPTVNPLRIRRLTLTDFRAFPGPTPAHFDFSGKNVLVYGENGAGKSSLFHALRNLFSFSLGNPPSLAALKNVFSAQPSTACAVEVEFNDGKPPATWRLQLVNGVYRDIHPATLSSGASDSRVISACLRKACLDYRALLDTNYRQGDGAVNLFAIAVERLLADYPVSISGSSHTIGVLWGAIAVHKQMLPSSKNVKGIQRVTDACAAFNQGFRQALAALQPELNTTLQALLGPNVSVTLQPFAGVTFNRAYFARDRRIDGESLGIEVRFRNHTVEKPQHFLNEARLSAIAVAIYLAGRLACTPTATADALKLLVLDDVLIGLDHSNRLPVLDVIQNRFADWQVVLLTHDRTWFDLARQRLPESEWVCIEIYEGDLAAKAPLPIVRPTANRPAVALLDKASQLVKLGFVEAAANYTRQAFEAGMHGACELKKIELPYQRDPKSIQAQDFLDKLMVWKVTGSLKQADWDAALKRVELFKAIVMNPYSHPSAPNIPRQEVEDAISAVTAFLKLVRTK
jgi:energy-coupling factor transporter ATP-binding protein EcfA2